MANDTVTVTNTGTGWGILDVQASTYVVGANTTGMNSTYTYPSIPYTFTYPQQQYFYGGIPEKQRNAIESPENIVISKAEYDELIAAKIERDERRYKDILYAGIQQQQQQSKKAQTLDIPVVETQKRKLILN